jgi:hypothetical protein
LYSSELVAAKVAVEMIIELRLALRTMGVPVKGPAIMFGDNKSVVMSTAMPSSTLKKKHCGIAYHRVREAIAAGIVRFIHIPGITNEADILTKPLAKAVFFRLLRQTLFKGIKEDKDDDNEEDVAGTSTRVLFTSVKYQLNLQGSGFEL